jgi:hypothetical protein
MDILVLLTIILIIFVILLLASRHTISSIENKLHIASRNISISYKVLDKSFYELTVSNKTIFHISQCFFVRETPLGPSVPVQGAKYAPLFYKNDETSARFYFDLHRKTKHLDNFRFEIPSQSSYTLKVHKTTLDSLLFIEESYFHFLLPDTGEILLRGAKARLISGKDKILTFSEAYLDNKIIKG